ncbi:hypothetical protein AAEU28_08680 [Pseudoalteromonas sp. SS15]|uniref:hypothetical protein n=1 Tax=Pseudoalteromonas sp. SS15 TaxID=3139393 RepID=UPI003BA91F59
MGNKKFNLTKLALAMGVTLGLAGCFSDNDNNIDIKPPVPEEPDTVVVGELPDGAVAQKQAAAFTVSVEDLSGAALGTADAPVTVRITKGADKVVSLDGSELAAEELTLNAGTGIFSAAVADVSEEVTVTVNFTADGFINNSTTFTLSSDNTDESATVRLVPRTSSADTPVKVAAESKAVAELVKEGETLAFDEETGAITVTDENGDPQPITLAKEIEAATEKDDKGGVEVVIPSGRQMLYRDSEGELKPLTSAPELTVAYFNNEASTATEANNNGDAASQARESSTLDVFPGGLDLEVPVPASDATDAAEAPQAGAFTTAGFVAIELTDAEGNKVKEFGETDGKKNSIEVKMTVDANTANACPMNYGTTDLDQETVAAFATDSTKATDSAYFRKGACVTVEGGTVASRTVKEGDIIPVWSYDADEAQWSFESYGVAQKVEGNDSIFNVAVQVTHLSYWNLDFFNWREPNRGQCGTNGRVEFDIVYGGENEVQNSTPFSLLVESQTNGYRKLKRARDSFFFDKSTILNPPSFPVFLQFLESGENIIDGVKGDENNPVDGTATRLKLDDVCELDGKTVVLVNEEPVETFAQPFKTELVCNVEGADQQGRAASATTVYLFQDGSRVGSIRTGNDGTAVYNNLVAGDYTARAANTTANNALTEAVSFTASATEVALEIPVANCVPTEKPVTGTGGS